MTEIDRSLEVGAEYVVLVLWRTKFVFCFVALFVFAAVAIVTLQKQPEFTASAQLVSGPGSLQAIGGSTQRNTQLPATLSIIAESQDVLRTAVEQVGLDRVVGPHVESKPSLRAKVREWIALARHQLRPDEVVQAPPEVSRIDVLLPLVGGRLSVRADPKAEILTIAFRHPDPVIAAQMANAISTAVVNRQVEIFTRSGIADFFEKQKIRFEQEYKAAADALEGFSLRSKVYSLTDQREALIRRQADLSAALTATRGKIADKVGERQALSDSLRRLAPVARSPFVSALVDSLGGDRDRSRAPDPRLEDRTSDPPLLLIRVYQDSMAALFKLNAEIAGAQSLQQQQTAEIAVLTVDLDTLSERQMQYSELRRIVDQAALNFDLFTKRTTEEQINAEANTARFSAVKLLQEAAIPISPTSPNLPLSAAVALGAGIVAGLAAAFLRHWTRRPVRIRTMSR